MLQTYVHDGLVPFRRQAITHTHYMGWFLKHGYGIFGNMNVTHTEILQVYVREGFTDYGHCDEKWSYQSQLVDRQSLYFIKLHSCYR